MHTMRLALLALLLTAGTAAQQAQAPCAGLPPGKHALLEKMTAKLELTCEQQVSIERLLHDEESVSKPLLKFTSFSAAERQEVMLTIKLAARRQIRPLLTRDQQSLLDQDMTDIAKTRKPGGKKKAAALTHEPAFEDQAALSMAVMNYAALTSTEKEAIILRVKRAARADDGLRLTAEQQKKLDADIAALTPTQGVR
jgi:hypothetical protein